MHHQQDGQQQGPPRLPTQCMLLKRTYSSTTLLGRDLMRQSTCAHGFQPLQHESQIENSHCHSSAGCCLCLQLQSWQVALPQCQQPTNVVTKGLTSMMMSTSKLPTLLRKGWPALTMPETLMSRSLFREALKRVLLVPRATVIEVNTSLQTRASLSLRRHDTLMLGLWMMLAIVLTSPATVMFFGTSRHATTDVTPHSFFTSINLVAAH